MEHVRSIAQEARPIGSSEHERVRAYIADALAAQGVTPEVQESTGVNNYSQRTHAATVHNVMGRLNGEDNTRAVLLTAHYDSVPNSPGASDDASGVATLLETLRALRSGPALKNDVIFLFTDGKEAGLLGSIAFMENHPWAKDAGVVLNFEARGTGGPVFMFETTRSHENWLVKKLAKAVEHPVATSYMYEIYKRLPDDTDLSVIKSKDVEGFNFAYIGGQPSFHTRVDDIKSLDQGSLQHNGLYALALTRELGNTDLNNTEQGNAVYFDVLGLTLVHYELWLADLLGVVVALMFALALAIGFWKKRLTFGGTMLGLVALLSSLICVVSGAHLARQLIFSLLPTIESSNRSRNLMFVGFIVLTIAIVSGVYYWFAKRVKVVDLAMGGLLSWLLMMLLTMYFLPGVSYLFAWPLLFSLIPISLLFVLTDKHLGAPGFFALLCLSAIPGIILVVPTTYALFLGVGLTLPEALMILPTLLIGLLILQLSLFTRIIPKAWLFICATSVVAVALLGISVLTAGHGADYPKANSLFYGLNVDTGTAVWASTDIAPDQWTSQFISAGAGRSDLSDFFPLNSGPFLNSPAPTKQLLPPVITQIAESVSNGIRTLRLRIASTREASIIDIVTEKDSEIVSAEVNGKKINPVRNHLRLRYFGLPREGIELKLGMNASQPLSLRIADYTYSFAKSTGIPVQQRPENLRSSLRDLWTQDSAAVSKSYTF
jgi:hypothetical protein